MGNVLEDRSKRKLQDWVVVNRNKYATLSRREIAEEATKFLGQNVTVSNLDGAERVMGVKMECSTPNLFGAASSSSLDARIRRLEEQVVELSNRIPADVQV